ncbi:TPA: TraI domain-containing protein [Yersinia enterocolitica]|uniref:TraI domain-containing protein n=1 Tax=Yersinia enterocolitica TaxID=630 RepID=UPI0005E0B33A|nr:TraI domain-containing protein [Yersinia enterocolitica]CNF71458.1 helicase [Yersinia enterocolitica]CRY24862.1 helicase [Yersinia enterocolitica]HDM8291206.1 TraI domain-containing protein [Yersinia enterocolitica]HDM8295335.1 TraI domain-containing protein [Yersinia enterocolitica]HDM8320320.1 TraI domain-containing protein [Yersinia enterocolitica]
MLKSLLKYLPVSSVKISSGEKSTATQLLSVQIPNGYHAPVSAREQLATPRRRQCLQMLWDYSSLPNDMYQQYYLQPLEHCVTLMQQFPATESDHHAYLGGMVDHLLETVAYAARLSKNYLLPVGAQPEEQASQSAAWNSVIVYAAMLQSLDRLCQIEVELQSGQRWIPLNFLPGEPYRFRFTPMADTVQVQSLSAMLAWKIIPYEALIWLSTWPNVLKILSLYLTGFRHESGIVNTIVLDAIRVSAGSSFESPAELPVDTANEQLIITGYDGSDIKQNTVPIAQNESFNLGSIFHQWVKKSILEQLIAVNTIDSSVFIISGYVFMRSPTIFYQFMAENKQTLGEPPCDWRMVQKQFEKLKLHKRQTNGVNVYCCEEKEGSKSFNGYLIPVAKIYGAVSPPADSLLMILRQ